MIEIRKLTREEFEQLLREAPKEEQDQPVNSLFGCNSRLEGVRMRQNALFMGR